MTPASIIETPLNDFRIPIEFVNRGTMDGAFVRGAAYTTDRIRVENPADVEVDVKSHFSESQRQPDSMDD